MKKKYQVFFRIEGEIEVEAENIEEAEELAEEGAYAALKYTGDFEIEDMYELGLG